MGRSRKWFDISGLMRWRTIYNNAWRIYLSARIIMHIFDRSPKFGMQILGILRGRCYSHTLFSHSSVKITFHSTKHFTSHTCYFHTVLCQNNHPLLAEVIFTQADKLLWPRKVHMYCKTRRSEGSFDTLHMILADRSGEL